MESKNKINWVFTIHVMTIFTLGLYGLTQFTFDGLIAFVVLYFLSLFGITFGFHRYFTHRSFKLPKPVEYVVAFLGTLAAQGGVFKWVAQHRMHHSFTETDADPHSAGKGLWHAHIGWIFRMPMASISKETLLPYARDIARDPVLMFMSTFTFETVLQLALFAGLWAAFGFEVAMWGVFVRLVATYNAIWAVNSFGHTYGYRRYESKDRSTNNWFLGLVTFGEGFHNNHHAHEKCAFHGHAWWEIDVNGWIIRLLEIAGIATNVKRLEAIRMPAEAESYASRAPRSSTIQPKLIRSDSFLSVTENK